MEVVGPTLELADSTFGHLLPNTAHFDQIEMFPVGMIISWVGDYGQVPNGWLLCHGQNLTGYETDLLRLYQIMPDYHGVGFFHTPDFRGRSPIGAGGDGVARKWELGERWGDKRVGSHVHQNIVGWGGGSGAYPVWDGTSDKAPYGMASTTANIVEPGVAVAYGLGANYQPSTGVNFLIYCGQDTSEMKDLDNLGNVPEVSTRMMIEARLAEADIDPEEVKMLKEQLEALKTTEAK